MKTPLLVAGILLLAQFSFAQSCVPEPPKEEEEAEGLYTPEQMRLLKPEYREIYTLVVGDLDTLRADAIKWTRYNQSKRQIQRAFKQFGIYDEEPGPASAPANERLYKEMNAYFREEIVACLKNPERLSPLTYENTKAAEDVCKGMPNSPTCQKLFPNLKNKP